MIAEGDSVARNAFRVALASSRDVLETPLPVASVTATQELDPNDILEVRDMAQAIARADKIVAAPRSSARGLTDLFDSLGRRPTDDAVGPSIAAPPGIPTPIPPRYVTMPSALPLASEDDAYYHPAGRMRSLADQTLDGYRPEPTLLLRARARRKRFSWLLAAALVPLLALAAVAVSENAEEATHVAHAALPASTTTSPLPTPAVTAVMTAATTATAATAATAATTTPATTTAPEPPVFDVKNLPSADSKPRGR